MSYQPQIQRFETTVFNYHPLFCLYCGQKVIGDEFTPCQHTLFIGLSDTGFEYRSPRLDALLGRTGIDDVDEDDNNVDAVTNRIRLDGAIKIESFVPPPSGAALYVGFAPDTEMDDGDEDDLAMSERRAAAPPLARI